MKQSLTAFKLQNRVARKPITHHVLLLITGFFSLVTAAQEQDSIQKLDEVLVQSVRATVQSPVTFSNITKQELAPRNLGQDIPVLLNYLPSVVTTTDAGNGFGYTYIRVRGSDASRINVTLNGIPYNDAESQGTFWVNMGDFASSVQSIQLQRGVGTSTNGAGAFGASLNLLTDSYGTVAGGEVANSFGSFNSRKHTVKFTTGLLGDKFELAGRLSNIKSDGYIDRAFSDLKSYYLQGTYISGGTLIKALAFGGTQQTYQAWNGIDAETLVNSRRYNPSGAYTDEAGNTRFYDNETDNYKQDHYQLHWNQRINPDWNATVALHYTIGKGYFENYRDDADFAEYGLSPLPGETVTVSDLVTQKWLDNDFYGTTFSANYNKGTLNFNFGGAYNKYEGDHFGKVIWSQYSQTTRPDDRYYDDYAAKTDFNIYAKANWQINKWFNLFADMQYRTVNYRAGGVLSGPVDDTFNFFNPKGGATFTIDSNNNIYASYARANREPRRDDYENGSFKHEELNDFELGWRYNASAVKINVNAYYMRYKNQLVLTGALNDVGAPVYTNSGDSYRLGIEADAAIAIGTKFVVRPNISISRNRNIDFYFRRDGVVQNLGETDIAFSPSLVAGNVFTYMPVKNLQVSLLSKVVGDQYMGNIDSDASRLKSYFVNDVNASYEFTTKTFIKSITLSALVNNIFDYQYESNGYFFTYDDDFTTPGTVTTIEGAGYYPQAGINFLLGATVKF